MGIRGLLAAGLTVLAVAMPGLAMAADSTLTLVIGGEGFDGPPKFAVSFGGAAVGEGTVSAAIDTTKAGRFADAADKRQFVQSFSFKIPQATFKPDARVAIRLTNEAHGAAGSKDDRQLYVHSVAVNGATVPADKLAMRSDAGIEPTAMLGDYLVVAEGAVEGIAAPPDGGWPKTDVASVEADRPAAPGAAEAAKPAEVTPAAKPAAVVAATAKPAEVKPAEQPPAVADKQVANLAAEAAPPTSGNTGETVTAEADAAAGNPDPEAGGPGCGLTKSFQITGFGENSNELTPRVNRQLDAVIEEIGTQRCVVHVSGYSSTEGDFAHNALFSIERAQNALHYLSAKGVKFRRYSANGVGETKQFGPSPNANRRVVVTVSP